MIHRKTLGPVSANLISSLYKMDKTIFTLHDAINVTGLKNTKAADLTSELVKRNIIARLKPGKYVIIPQELGEAVSYIGNWYVVAREIVKSPDYYISYYSAMEIHNMLTHPITTVFVTTPRQEYKKQRIIGNTTFEFIYMNEKSIWGIEKIWVTQSEQVRVSTIERTIIDCLYRPKYCGGVMEVIKGIWIQKEKVDFDKLFDYVIKFNKIVVIKRLGYILESLNLQDENYLSTLRAQMNNKYYALDPLLSTEKTYSNSWKLIANIGPDEMKKNVST
jgi:predicted transcriptional regulator of viral defense system